MRHILSLNAKTSQARYYFLLVALIFVGSLPAEITVRRVLSPDQSIRVLGGGWDHRVNNQPEFLAIQEPEDSLAPSVLVYYEETGAETLAVLWRYRLDEQLPARLVDADVTDLNGDGLPEIALLIYYTNVPDNSAPPWLHIFDWDPARFMFAREPTSSWNHTGRGISYLRPTQLVTADLDNDGDQELVIATGSPDKMVLIADWEAGKFQVIEELRPGKIISGAWPFSTAVADFNGDRRKDLLVMGHGERPAIQAYLSGRAEFHEISVAATIGKRILPEAVAAGDLNGDGQEEIVLPHADGSLTMVSMAGPRLAAAALDTRISGLVDLAIAELDGDAIAEMVYLQADGTITTNDAQFMTPVTRELVRSRLPEGVLPPVSYDALIVVAPTEERPGSIVFPIHTSAGSLIAFAELGPQLTGRASFTGTDAAPGAEFFGVQAEGREVYLPGRPQAPDPRALPPNRTPDILLYVGDEFTQPVIGERIEQFASFRFLSKAPDMVFNFQRQAIVWQPTGEHLGAWNVAYEIIYHIGVNPAEMITDSILVPESEVVRDQILIYVNDKPRITSQPETLNLLAGHLFAYRIAVTDRNSDAHLDYRLESGPDGMTLDKNAIITWRTNETHHDDYQVVISVSDGFDKDVQTFVLNVNAQLTITSVVPHLAQLEEPYRYPVTIFQPGKPRDHLFTLTRSPDDMRIDAKGVIEWTPSSTQMDTQYFQVRISDGTAEDVQDGWIYVNVPPRMVVAPPRAVTVGTGDTLRLSFEGEDQNEDQTLEWNVVQGPVTMTIDSAGNLTWPTTLQDLDAYRFVVELTDGLAAVPFRGIAFVNDPIRITSVIPPDTATVGQPYSYTVDIRDVNRSALLKFRRPTVAANIARTTTYQIDVQDDKFRRDLPRYLAQFRQQKNIYINKPPRPEEGEVAQAARIDLRQHVKQIFVEDDQLVLVISSPQQGMVDLEDVLWELFQGGRGVMPQYTAQVVPYVYFSLQAFPDGMTVSDEGVITWTPTPSQAGEHQVRLMVSDGFTRDEQAYTIYANYPPAIISQADTLALIGNRYSYQVRVDDKNEDAQLTYRLIKSPEGMEVDHTGLVTWAPALEQINWREYEVEVSDGHSVDRQVITIFVNIAPRIISQPKAVALNSFEYTYRVVAEDLNRDAMRYRAVRLPRYSDFDARTGLFKWRPRGLQKGPNDIAFEVTDAHGAVTVHAFQVHVFEDPSRRQFLFTGWPLLLAFVGVIFVLGITVSG